jgi:hypothetical protein
VENLLESLLEAITKLTESALSDRKRASVNTEATPKHGEPNWSSFPAAEESEELPWIDIRFVIMHLGHIDTVNSTAKVKFRLFSYWTDARAIGWEGELPGSTWGPLFNFVNSVGGMNVTVDEMTLLNSSTGRIRSVIVYEGTLSNPMDLRQFPFDLDAVNVTLSTLSRWMSYDQTRHGKSTSRMYRVRPVSDPVEGHYMQLSIGNIAEFELHGVSSKIEEQAMNLANEERTYIYFGLHVSRQYGYYFYKVLVPLYSLTLLHLQVYLFDPRALTDRIATTVCCHCHLLSMFGSFRSNLRATPLSL